MNINNEFIPNRGNYRDLIAFRKAECIYDITYYFVNKYLSIGDRTVDQMLQAARSGKQNIAEGCSDSMGSKEIEIKLIVVARGSLQELLLDYEDYLRVRNLQLWDFNSEKAMQARNACRAHNDSRYYRNAIKERSDETIANIAITLIHQTDTLLGRYLEAIKQQFLEHGGIKEEMMRARIDYRKKNNS